MTDTSVIDAAAYRDRELSAAEATMVDNVMVHCLNVGRSEPVLVVADVQSRPLGELFAAGALRHAAAVQLIVMPVAERNGSEPPEPVAAALREHAVSLLPVSKSLTHTRARQAATAAGARVASMPSITHELALRTLTVDYTQIAAASQVLADRLSAATVVRITTPGGTDLELSLRGRTGLADTGRFVEPGMFGNLPAGEAFVAPEEGTAAGVLVIDAESIVPECPLGEPTVIHIAQGLVTSVRGTGADELNAVFADLGDAARNIAELGIGTNPAARLTGNLLESEKVAGTAHVALGNNAHFGGRVDVPFHNDGVIARPTIHADGEIIVADGRAVTTD